MTRLSIPLGSFATALALLSPFASAQGPGFEGEVRTLGIPGGGSKLRSADVTADGIPDSVLLHGTALSLLHGPYLYQDTDGNARVSPLGDGTAVARDFALMTHVGASQAAGVLSAGSKGLELFTWNQSVGGLQASLLVAGPDARLVSHWSVDTSVFSVVALIEGVDVLRVFVLLNSSGGIFIASPAVTLGVSGIRDIELLDWDGVGSPELAVLRDAELGIYQLDGSSSAHFPMNDPEARMAVLRYEPTSLDRIAWIDRDPGTGEWFLGVLDSMGVESPVPMNGWPLDLVAGQHDEDGLPDTLVTFATGSVDLYRHQGQGAPSFDASDVHGAFHGATSAPQLPVLATSLADLDGDGDGDVLAADSASRGWLAYGMPVDQQRWLVTVNSALNPSPSGTEMVRLNFRVTVPSDLPGSPATHVEVVTWEGSSQTELDPATRQRDIEPLSAAGAEVTVVVTLDHPELGGELNYVAEVRLVDEGLPLHAYPALWGDVKITFDGEAGSGGGKGPTPFGGGGGGGGGTLRGTFTQVPPGPPPPFPSGT